MPDGDKLKPQTRISAKGQVILPKAIRDRHGWAPGTVLEIEDGPGGITLRPKRVFPATRPADVAGMLKPLYSGPPKTIEEMNKAIEDNIRERHARGRY